MAGEPYPKETQLSRGERRYTRKVASPKRWQQIIDAKGDECRICTFIRDHPENAAEMGLTLDQDKGLSVSYHHLVPRGIGGSDTEANIVPIWGDGTSGHHGMVTRRHRGACTALRRSLTDDEYAYLHETLGEARVEERYPVIWEKP